MTTYKISYWNRAKPKIVRSYVRGGKKVKGYTLRTHATYWAKMGLLAVIVISSYIIIFNVGALSTTTGTEAARIRQYIVDEVNQYIPLPGATRPKPVAMVLVSHDKTMALSEWCKMAIRDHKLTGSELTNPCNY